MENYTSVYHWGICYAQN